MKKASSTIDYRTTALNSGRPKTYISCDMFSYHCVNIQINGYYSAFYTPPPPAAPYLVMSSSCADRAKDNCGHNIFGRLFEAKKTSSERLRANRIITTRVKTMPQQLLYLSSQGQTLFFLNKKKIINPTRQTPKASTRPQTHRTQVHVPCLLNSPP